VLDINYLGVMRISSLLCAAFLANAAITPAGGQTGIPIPSMTYCDDQVQDLLNTFGVPGAEFALAKDGKLVYDRAFGHSDIGLSIPTRPYNLFRLASVSKPITSVAVMALLEQGQLQLDDHVFGPGGLLEDHPYIGAVTYADMRLNDVTIHQLLQHTAGWNRDVWCFPDPTDPYPWQTPGCDPISAPLYVTSQLFETNPVSKYAMVRFLMEHGLDHDPGTVYAYSNIGYLVLGIVIEQITGMSYEAYVQSLLSPLGICDLHAGHNLITEKQEREAEYMGEGYQTLSCYGTGEVVPWEYGGWSVEAMDAHGGWIASARDLVKFLVAVDGFSSKPDILSAATLTTMTTPTWMQPNYACGWAVNQENNWWHTGSLDGTATMIARSFNGYTWAILLNKRLTVGQVNAFWTAIDQLGWNCISSTSSWPTHDLMDMPTLNAVVTNILPTVPTMEVQCSPGDGDGRIVTVHVGSSTTAFPLDGYDYTANTVLGLGDDLGDETYVVATGNVTSVTVSGLRAGTAYTVRVYEYTQNATTGQNALYMLCGSEDHLIVSPEGVDEMIAGQDLHVRQQGSALVISTTGLAPGTSLQLYDATGRSVFERAQLAPSDRVEVDGLSSGLFVVSLIRNGVPAVVRRISVVR
jgi:CubicO group peptidase (beta-lactamase class C family)